MLKTNFTSSDLSRSFDIAGSVISVFRRSRRVGLMGIAHFLRGCTEGLIEGIRTAREMPAQGDVGTHGGDLTRWIVERNGRD